MPKGHGEGKTEGTDKDYDESQESKNQGHGHPRNERKGFDKSGQSFRTLTEQDKRERDLGGPGG